MNSSENMNQNFKTKLLNSNFSYQDFRLFRGVFFQVAR
jgi:hypothetical protein